MFHEEHAPRFHEVLVAFLHFTEAGRLLLCLQLPEILEPLNSGTAATDVRLDHDRKLQAFCRFHSLRSMIDYACPGIREP